ncbi:hypothetical protein jhhlp_003021 [Lomentospora prolificans]|uniref:PEBP-like protein n=1 Tax=Lomentospora prolificans TaxID=41688 RepID=A0A2N3NFN5_9PEZI|nr:hypothetical protein jhhlp_003021 [Lomentospora prolificans]
MKLLEIAGIAAFAGLAFGQTPAGFEPAVEANLAVSFGSKAVEEPGTSFTKEETAAIPTIGTAEPLKGTYIFAMIDISVPASFSPGNYEPRRNMLHALVSGFTSSAEANADGIYVLENADPSGPAAYIGPSPPAETPPNAHNYVELLFEQTDAYKAPQVDYSGFNNRLGVDVAELITTLGLGEPVAANYFNVTGV